MKLSLRLEPKETYLSAVFDGTFEAGEAQALSLSFLEACGELGLSKVLVDTRLMTGQLTVVERYEYAEFMSRQVVSYILRGRLKRPRLAYVGNPPIIDPHQFGVVVAVNRGVRAKATYSPYEALEWLEVEPFVPPPAR